MADVVFNQQDAVAGPVGPADEGSAHGDVAPADAADTAVDAASTDPYGLQGAEPPVPIESVAPMQLVALLASRRVAEPVGAQCTRPAASCGSHW